MEIIGLVKLEKLKRKNRGNKMLCNAIDNLIDELVKMNFTNQEELRKVRPDADLVHNDGFYFFDIHLHRVMILIEFDQNGQASICWCGSHDDYESTFKNNKNTIKRWLRSQGFTN